MRKPPERKELDEKTQLFLILVEIAAAVAVCGLLVYVSFSR